MRHSKQIWTRAAVAAFLVMAALPAVSATGDSPASGSAVAGTWQHRHAKFTYYGITSLYSCSGLETNISQLLRHLGARKDAKVRAIGCPRGYDTPGRNALVELDFYSLAPSTDANGADTVQARWTPVQVTANRPYFIEHGDCELMDEIKDVLTKNFSFRDLKYRTDCVPHQVNINDFSVNAEVLKPLPATVASAKQG
jgi:hypothetical protein